MIDNRKRRGVCRLLLIVAAQMSMQGQTKIDLRAQGRTVDFSGAESTKPARAGALLPPECETGEMFLWTDGSTATLYLCASNMWSMVEGRGAGGLEVEQPSPGAGALLAATDDPARIRGTQLHSDGSSLTVPGSLSVGGGISSGLQWSLGKAGDTGASSLSIRGGNGLANSEPGYLQLFGSGVNPAQVNLFACGEADGALCLSPASPGAGSTNWVATVGTSNTWTARQTYTDGIDAGAANYTAPARKGFGAPGQSCVEGEQYFRLDAEAGRNLYFCTATDAWTQMSGTQAWRTILGVANKITVTNGGGVEGDPVIGIGEDVVDRTAATLYAAGAKQVFQASGATAGQRIACGELPSIPEAGDLACDASDGNRLKQYDGVAWGVLGQQVSAGWSDNDRVSADPAAQGADETAFAKTYVLPAGWLASGRTLRVNAGFQMTTGSAPPALNIRLTMRRAGDSAAVTLYERAAASTPRANMNGEGWGATWTVQGTSAAGGAAPVDAFLFAFPFPESAFGGYGNGVAQPVMVDTASGQEIVVTAHWSSPEPGNHVDLRSLIVEVLK